MVVSADAKSYIVASKEFGGLVPVVHISLHQRIVGDYDNGVGSRITCHTFLQPGEVLWHHMPQGHAHERTGVESQEMDTLMAVLESLIAEHLLPCRTAAVAPFGFMVAQHDIVRHLQMGEAFLHGQQGGTVATLAHITGHQYKIDTL